MEFLLFSKISFEIPDPTTPSVKKYLWKHSVSMLKMIIMIR